MKKKLLEFVVNSQNFKAKRQKKKGGTIKKDKKNVKIIV